MSYSFVMSLIFACAALLVWGVMALVNDVFFRYRAALQQRVAELNGRTRAAGEDSALFDLKHLNAATDSTRNTWTGQFEALIEQTGWQGSVSAAITLELAWAFTAAIAGYLIARHWWGAPVGFVLGGMGPYFFLRARRTAHIRRMTRQLPDVFDTMARAVRSGQTAAAAFQMIADEFKPPVSEEFRYCYEQQQLGIPFDVALRDLGRRIPVMELRILVVALLVQQRSGGNLVELLSGLSSMARKRLRLQMRMKALTGEARAQAVILIILPIVALMAVMLLAPDYGRALWQRPWLLGVTVAAQVIGAQWIRSIVRFNV